jgi:putative ABC transport system ATP-binding protein
MNVPVKEREKRGRELLRKFGINEIIEKKIPANMSGGQQQRVAVARAMVNDPEILLADEPVGNLDSISAEQVMNKLEEINMKDRKTVILVTHDAKYLPYAHRVFYMKDGALRRIVINPEKEQIKRVKPGETIVTEIEQLARMYPYSEPLELKVKSIVNFLTQDMGFTQIQRLEKAVLAVLAGKLSKDMFYEYLLKPVSRGGVGIDAGPASQMSDRMEKIIIQSQNIKKYRNLTHQDRLFLNQYKFIERVFDFIKNECGLSMTSDLSKALSNAISERVGGIITREEFEQRMVLPVNLGGLGFEEKMMILIARHLEKLIAQGAYIIGEAVH